MNHLKIFTEFFIRLLLLLMCWFFFGYKSCGNPHRLHWEKSELLDHLGSPDKSPSRDLNASGDWFGTGLVLGRTRSLN